MLNAHFMIRADNRPLQEAPHAFNPVGMNVADNPLLSRMINPSVLRIGIVNSPVSWHFVRVDRFGIWRGVIMNELVENDLGSIRNNLKANLAFALNGSDGDCFVAFVAAPHATSLSADVGF